MNPKSSRNTHGCVRKHSISQIGEIYTHPVSDLAFHSVAFDFKEKFKPATFNDLFRNTINRTTENAMGPLLDGARDWKFHDSCLKITLTTQSDSNTLEEMLEKIHKETYIDKLKRVYIPADITYKPKPK